MPQSKVKVSVERQVKVVMQHLNEILLKGKAVQVVKQQNLQQTMVLLFMSFSLELIYLTTARMNYLQQNFYSTAGHSFGASLHRLK